MDERRQNFVIETLRGMHTIKSMATRCFRALRTRVPVITETRRKSSSRTTGIRIIWPAISQIRNRKSGMKGKSTSNKIDWPV